ncbi:protein fem-1 homolog CG6966 isoform X2 [Osmia lignaria lignaria]|uniref:protein fem-1 homolog CG6966 isoform X2 n=1 Tax=Osmia bicornis bicornis TaxID=1437191 RepID=UPI0010F7C605|nr:protein fem-1 homolog CG6966 isoform X2 [Osmia bicornis bicornis]XP_029044540.1 protein fem-1 homolog CG6966 isoform X2 [Osmia bicornis bicornis]XP_034195441.1 protein fem-1 homolog CG6966 isoform X2 [Osmia lignaria]XP_034195443.1 protein fem-1 homolog CG6966 isoform X2 [Osmia lignaria]
MEYEANEEHFTRVFLDHRGKDEVGQLVGAKTHGATPLVMACRNGHYDVAEYLIKECGADIEQPGSVVFGGETIEGAPPLWCAAAAGHLALVRLLVKRGAKVNSTTKTNSTPLRAACFDGYFEIVRFLVNHGADIEMANHQGHTSLMIACYKGHIKIAKFLLALKADVNRKSVRGYTALHDCAESGSLDIVKLLIEHGARMDVDSYGMTPLLVAAVTGHKHIVEYFIGIPNLVSRKERIDALELLGATYVDKERDMIGALEFWKRAMDERYRRDSPVIAKPLPPPVVAAYDFTREISNPDELDDLLTDPDEMRMQALVIRERILGPAHPDTSYYIRYRGALYADGGKFDRCIKLWNYALDMQQSMLEPLDPMTQSSLFSFTELFSFMIGTQTSTGRRVPPVQKKELLRVFKKAVLEVALGKQMLDKIPVCKRDLTYLNRVLVITLHLACLLTREIPEKGTDEYITLHKAIYELVGINAKGKQGRDVLQLIYSEKGAVVGSYSTSKFPSSNLANALIKVGADVTARDNDGNTALHLAAVSHFRRPDLAVTLLEAGAHIDTVNNEGKTFEMLLRDKRLYDSVCPVKYTTLTCLAARVVKRTYELEDVPKHLRAFVQMH